jgi:drug/metabolite transporter (DMT)-like permease
MLGIILGFGCAIAFATNAIVTRRGVLRASSNYIANISILTGPVFFLLVASVTKDLSQIGQFPWKAYLFLALSGVVHFALGRTWAYKSIQLIGTNRSYMVTSLYPIVSIGLAIIILGETIKPLMILGILCSLSSPFITFFKEKTVSGGTHLMGNSHGKEVDRHTLYLGMLYGMGAAVFWGSSFIFIKLGLENGGSPVAGSLLAYLGASIAIIPSLLNRKNKREMLEADRKSFQLGLFGGLTANIAQLLRYLALGYGSVIIVTVLMRTSPLWVLLLSFIYNREYESFSRWVLLSNALLIVGTVLILIV